MGPPCLNSPSRILPYRPACADTLMSKIVVSTACKKAPLPIGNENSSNHLLSDDRSPPTTNLTKTVTHARKRLLGLNQSNYLFNDVACACTVYRLLLCSSLCLLLEPGALVVSVLSAYFGLNLVIPVPGDFPHSPEVRDCIETGGTGTRQWAIWLVSVGAIRAHFKPPLCLCLRFS